ncbi:MAG: hypothetical protein QXQ14_01335 [Candidatus Aenigmatarchaeota archaeon]
MEYLDTNILISYFKKNKEPKGIISTFSLIELERLRKIENLTYNFEKLEIIELKNIKIDFSKLFHFSQIVLDKSYLADFIHLEICLQNNLTFLTKDKKLEKLKGIYKLKII